MLLERVNPKDIEAFAENEAVRIAFAETDFHFFCMTYLTHNFPLDMADFHHEIFETLMSDDSFVSMIGFRGSAKSTILEAFALWRFVTKQSDFIVYVGATDSDAKKSLANIRAELEENKLLKADFDIQIDKKTTAGTSKWSEGHITYDGRAMLARSRNQKVRGLKFKGNRIDLIIVDDLEDVEATRTLEKRKKTREWFFSEVAQATKQGVLAKDTKIIMIGNLVHRDCLLEHLNRSELVTVHKFPLIDDEGNITWKGLYPDMDAIAEKKAEVLIAGEGMGNIIWQREYLLKIVDDADQIITMDDIQYYDDKWLQKDKKRGGVGVDLAISKAETADYTAMTKIVEVENDYGEARYLVLKGNLKKRIGFTETVGEAKLINAMMPERTTFYVEDVAYQKSAIEMFQKNGLKTVGMKVTKDKRARLFSVASYIQSGIVLFPKDGADDIIEELLGFGIEEHDDQVDSLVHAIDGMLNMKQRRIVSA